MADVTCRPHYCPTWDFCESWQCSNSSCHILCKHQPSTLRSHSFLYVFSFRANHVADLQSCDQEAMCCARWWYKNGMMKHILWRYLYGVTESHVGTFNSSWRHGHTCRQNVWIFCCFFIVVGGGCATVLCWGTCPLQHIASQRSFKVRTCRRAALSACIYLYIDSSAYFLCSYKYLLVNKSTIKWHCFIVAVVAIAAPLWHMLFLLYCATSKRTRPTVHFGMLIFKSMTLMM